MNWINFGGPGSSFHAHAHDVYGLSPDKEVVAFYNGTTYGYQLFISQCSILFSILPVGEALQVRISYSYHFHRFRLCVFNS